MESSVKINQNFNIVWESIGRILIFNKIISSVYQISKFYFTGNLNFTLIIVLIMKKKKIIFA